MNATGNQPIFENEAARASYFKDRVDAVNNAYKEGLQAHAEFIEKETELHKRTEALIAEYPSGNPDESANIPFFSYIPEQLDAVNAISLAVRFCQKVGYASKGKEPRYIVDTIEYIQLEEGKLPRLMLSIQGFNTKVYGHNTRPGVGTRKSIEAVHGYEIQATYDARLSELENLILPSEE